MADDRSLIEQLLSFGDGSRPAILDADGTATIGELAARSAHVAARLGVAPSRVDAPRVAVLAEPGRLLTSALMGIWRGGHCACVLSPHYPPPESTYLLDDARVERILCTAAMRERVEAIRGAREVVAIDPAPPGRVIGEPELPPDITQRAALQLYTSGTTGRPKGAVLSQHNLETQTRIVGEAWGVSEHDVLLHALPLHHMHGLVIAHLTALANRGTTRFLPKFDAHAVWSALESVTTWMAVPTMYKRLFDALEDVSGPDRMRYEAGARALRLATSGSAALPVGLADRWGELQGRLPLERYGMTEIGVGLSNPLAGERIRGTVGFPLPSVETRIVGDDSEPRDEGELWVRGPSVFSAYFDKPDATREAFAADPAGGAPWFRTGDRVSRDAAGRFRILGRSSVDIIKSGGYKLSALEIEDVLRELPEIADVAVVGVPDDDWGEAVCACIQLAGADPPSLERIRTHVRTTLAPYKSPRRLKFVDALPRNALGKVQKPTLVQWFADDAKTETRV